MSATPKALILRAPGINCERETFDALARAGAAPEYVHVRRLVQEPELLDRYRIFAAPGGFAYGDDIAAGRVLANELRAHVGEKLVSFVDRGGLVLGICNGFQMLVRLGLLPRVDGDALRQDVTLTHNLTNRYECRWIRMRAVSSRCVFLPEGLEFSCPAAHGEGRLVARDEALQQQLESEGYRTLVYLDASGRPAKDFPDNPNGSPGAAAGMTDRTGRVLGLMPHPDRAYLRHHMPQWRLGPEAGDDGEGMIVFRELVRVAQAEG
jgi:phosphoribosylformylglycinamidine synthase I